MYYTILRNSTQVVKHKKTRFYLGLQRFLYQNCQTRVLKLRDSISLKLHVKQSEFAIMQGFDNQKLKSAIIYTENLDKNYLDQLVDTAASVDLQANPKIKVLTLSNNC